MIKYIGQHIFDFIARFRNDIYLENIADGTVDSDKFLGLDSSGKVVKETVVSSSGDITGVDITVGTGLDISQSNTTSGDYSSTINLDLTEVGVSGSANQLLTDDGDGTVTSESEVIYNAGVFSIESATSQRPSLRLTNTNTDAEAPEIYFKKSATGADDDGIANVFFVAENDADETITYAKTQVSIADASDTDEAGKYEIKVACSDGSTSGLQTAFSATGTAPTSLQTEVDVNIGHGEFSNTNIAGSMTIGGANTSGDTFSITANPPTGAGNGANFKILGSEGNGTNQDGGTFSLYGGASTGTGTGGAIKLYGTGPGSSGSSANSAQSRFTFNVGVDTPYLDIGPQSLGVKTMMDFNSETFENTIANAGDSRQSTILRYAPAGSQGPLGVGEIYFLQTDGSWAQADASATSTGATQLLGVTAVGGALPSKGIVLEGFIRIPAASILNTPGSGAVDGLPVYVSTTAGHFDFTAPSGNNEYVRCVGYAIDDHSGDVLVYLKPDNTFVKITA